MIQSKKEQLGKLKYIKEIGMQMIQLKLWWNLSSNKLSLVHTKLVLIICQVRLKTFQNMLAQCAYLIDICNYRFWTR